MTLRSVQRTIEGQETSDGAGVRLRRSLGTAALDHLDPFLLFDEFKSDRPDDYLAGFPDHPHRGFETVTYMLAGRMEHRDHAGNRGNLVAGSVQWMTAGRGIVHSEMPRQEDGLMWGFQLWVNLPSDRKMSPPRYQDIPPGDIPQIEFEGARVRVLAGRLAGVEGPVRGIVTDPIYLDVALRAAAAPAFPVDAGHHAFIYVYEGAAAVDSASGSGTDVAEGRLAVLGPGDAVRLRAAGQGPARLVLIAGRPIGEPIARYGPVVMNTEAELRQAFRDLQDGTFL